MIKYCAAGLLAAIAAPAMAQVDPPVPSAAPAAAATAPIDPAKLALARAIVTKVMPPGYLREIMSRTMGPLTDKMVGEMKNMPLGRMLEAYGMPPDQARKITMANVMQIAAILDPAYQRRQQLSMKAMIDGMLDILSSVEPEMLDAMAMAYARNFDTTQLDDINHFFNTPSGEVYARRAAMLAADPGVRDVSVKMMPKMMEAMPDLIRKVQAATASLPKPRDPKTLTDAERNKIAQLLGVDPSALKKKPVGGS